MTTAIIVQARMTSTRLPGKVLKSVLGKSLLEHQIERLQRVEKAEALVIATTTHATDDPIVERCQALGVDVFCGSEQDVLSRYHGAAQAVRADVVVRVTSDCPLIDPQVIDQVIQVYRDSHVDYASNALQRTFPRGMDTEVFSLATLTEAHQEAAEPLQREHVTPFIYQHPERYTIAHVTYPQDLSHHRWTVDTPEDFELIQRILEALYPQIPLFTLQNCLALVERHPDWSAINAHVEQKKYGE